MLNFAFFWFILLLPLPLLLVPRLKAWQPPIEGIVFPIQHSESTSKRTRSTFIWVIWILIVLMAMRPQWLGETSAVQKPSRDMYLVLDLSNSMSIQDMSVGSQSIDRLQALKLALNDFIPKRKGDRLGMVVFGENAYPYIPLSADIDSVNELMLQLSIGMAGNRTALADGLAVAIKQLVENENEQKVVILLSDGKQTAGQQDIEQVIEYAKTAEVTVYAIGFGATEMIQRGFFSNQTVNPSADLDEATLKGIAAELNGQYFRATNQKELNSAYDSIDQLQAIGEQEIFFRQVNELFPYLLVVILVLLLFTSKRRWL